MPEAWASLSPGPRPRGGGGTASLTHPVVSVLLPVAPGSTWMCHTVYPPAPQLFLLPSLSMCSLRSVICPGYTLGLHFFPVPRGPLRGSSLSHNPIPCPPRGLPASWKAPMNVSSFPLCCCPPYRLLVSLLAAPCCPPTSYRGSAGPLSSWQSSIQGLPLPTSVIHLLSLSCPVPCYRPILAVKTQTSPGLPAPPRLHLLSL